ncbi:hypothetical protein B0T21DRAFT_359382, partial [Apiosordaria backusii]
MRPVEIRRAQQDSIYLPRWKTGQPLRMVNQRNKQVQKYRPDKVWRLKGARLDDHSVLFCSPPPLPCRDRNEQEERRNSSVYCILPFPSLSPFPPQHQPFSPTCLRLYLIPIAPAAALPHPRAHALRRHQAKKARLDTKLLNFSLPSRPIQEMRRTAPREDEKLPGTEAGLISHTLFQKPSPTSSHPTSTTRASQPTLQSAPSSVGPILGSDCNEIDHSEDDKLDEASKHQSVHFEPGARDSWGSVEGDAGGATAAGVVDVTGEGSAGRWC